VLTTAFLRAVKRAIAIPAYQARFTDEDFLELGNEEQRSYLVPFITNLRENYFVVYEDVVVPKNQLRIDIPERAAGRAIVNMVYKEGTSDSTKFMPLEQLSVEKTWRFNESVFGRPTFYSFLADEIRILPPPQVDGMARIYYEELPSDLALEKDCAKITAVGANSVVVDAIPPAWKIGQIIDITSIKPGFRPAQKDLVITAINVLTITFSVNLSGVVVGDYLSKVKETCILQMPVEISDLLVQAVARRVCASRGVDEITKQVDQVVLKKEKLVAMLLTPRDKGNRRVISNNNSLIGGRKRYQMQNNFNG
jgi:hypothetical protein